MGRRPEQQTQQGSQQQQQGGQGEGRPQAERRTERRPPRERRPDKPAEDKPAEGGEFSAEKWDWLIAQAHLWIHRTFDLIPKNENG